MILTGYGRLGRDAELRYTGSGDPVANLSIAFNWGKPGQDGKKPTQWIEAALFGKRAEALASFLKKGKGLDVIVTDVHVEQDHEKKYPPKLVGRIMELEFVDGGQRDQSDSQPSQPSSNRQANKPRPSFEDLTGDDIPF